MARYRILQGKHVEGTGDNARCYSSKYLRNGRERPNWKQGDDVLESDKNLIAIFGSARFELLPDASGSASAAHGTSFSRMTISELTQVAEEEEIDLTGASTKREILDRIEQVLGPKSPAGTH